MARLSVGATRSTVERGAQYVFAIAHNSKQRKAITSFPRVALAPVASHSTVTLLWAGGSRRAAASPGSRRGQFCRLDADRPVHLCDRRAERQARAGSGRRQEPYGGDAGRRPRPGDRRADGGRLWVGRRALHGGIREMPAMR
jgi:hypothetical protein